MPTTKTESHPLFPSPCGEEVLNRVRKPQGSEGEGGWFPSPCGEEVLNHAEEFDIWFDSVVELFPSPCGEEVLNQPETRALELTIGTDVSVPLRGRGFESMSKLGLEELPQDRFPSPCGEEVLNRQVVVLPCQHSPLEFPSPCGEEVLNRSPPLQRR